jgi:hypothetical protein
MTAGSEARFTAPRADCPHPEYWHSTDSDSTEIEVTELVAAFVRAPQPETVLETGSAFGQTAEAIRRTLAANGHGRLVTSNPTPTGAGHGGSVGGAAGVSAGLLKPGLRARRRHRFRLV